MSDRPASALDGAEIARRRTAAGLSQRELARRIGTSATAVRALESGANHDSVTLGLLTRLAAGLETSPASLLRDPGEAISEPDKDDDVAEAALASLGRAVEIAELARALDWTLPRTRAALERARGRLSGGQRLIDAGWQKVALVPTSLGRRRELALCQLGPRRRGLTVNTARVLRQFLLDEIGAGWHQHAGNAERVALGELLNQGVLKIEPSSGELALGADCDHLSTTPIEARRRAAAKP